MNRDAQSMVLILLGGAVLQISLGEAYLRYVKESLQPFLIVSGVLLVALGLVSVIADNTGVRRRTDPGHGGPVVAWLLLLPVLTIFLVAPPALGSYSASRQSAEVLEPAQAGFPRLPDPDPGVDWVRLSMSDFAARAVWDDGESLAGRQVRLEGFVTPREGGGFYLTRMAVACCAADARPVRVIVDTASVPPAADTWLAVTGTSGPAEHNAAEGYPRAGARRRDDRVHPGAALTVRRLNQPPRQAAQRPKISRVWLTSEKPCSAATRSAHRSTVGPSTSSVRPHTRQTRWWWWAGPHLR